MKNKILTTLLILILVSLAIKSPAPSGGGGGGTTSGSVTATSITLVGGVISPNRIFYVSPTNTTDGFGAVNNTNTPYSLSHVFTLATNVGDIVYLLAGNYNPTGAITIPKGVTFRGLDRRLTVLNNTNTSACLIQPRDNVTIAKMTLSGGGVSHSIIGTSGSSVSWTNVLMDDIVGIGDVDWFYGDQGSISTNELTIQNSLITGNWDFFVPNLNIGWLVSINNKFIAATVTHPSGIHGSSQMPFIDYGSSFYNFGIVGSSAVIYGAQLNGSRFYNNPQSTIPGIFRGSYPTTGTIYDMDRGGVNYNLSTGGISYTLSTNGCYYNQIVLLNFGAPDTAANSTFTLKYAIGDVVHGQSSANTIAYYTNSSGYSLNLNDPFDLQDSSSGPPTWSIDQNGILTSRQLYQINGIITITNTILTNSSWSANNGVGAAGISYFTNTLIPLSQASIALPQMFGGTIAADWTGTNMTFTGNGSGITNTAQNTVIFTNFLLGSFFTNTTTRNVLVVGNARCNPTTTGNALFALVTSPTGAIYKTNSMAGLEADAIFTTAPHSWYQLTAQIPPGGIWEFLDKTGEGLVNITNSYYQTLQ